MKNKAIITRELIRSFGRVNGRKLRTGQTDLIEKLLPQFAVDMDNPLAVPDSAGACPPLFLEIGFGYGEHLVGMAQRYGQVNFIGCEPFINGVATLLKQIEESGLSNIRILHGDARLLIEKLPSACIDRLFILFPDPWPKARHHKKRLISAANLQDFARILKTGGRLEIATDHVAYGEWIAEHLAVAAEFKANQLCGVDKMPDDWVETRYQQKAYEQGRGARFFNFVRV